MKSTKLKMCMFLRRSDDSYHLHMCSHVLVSASLHRQWNVVLRKNLCQYSPIGTCPSIMWINLVHMELETPICRSHDPFLVYIGLMTYSLSFLNSRNSYLFFLLSLNVFCYVSSKRLYSFFLLNKNEFFSREIGRAWAAFAFSSTMVCLGHFSLLGQY